MTAVLKSIKLLVQKFRQNKQYAAEILSMLCNVHKCWVKDMTYCLFQSFSLGVPGGFVPISEQALC
jgi:hypothetical protein